MTRGSVTVRPFQPVGDEGLDNDPQVRLTQIFVYFLQNLFREFPEGYGMRWNPNDETSEIVVTAEKPEVSSVEKRPHIVCVLGAYRWSGLGLDQLQNSRASDGQRQHTDLVPGTISYHCQAKEGLVARRIAWNASQYTTMFRRLIMKEAGMHHVGVQHEVGPESGLTAFTGPVSETELVSVVVTVPFYWQPQWRIKGPSSVWRNMELAMNVNGPKPAGQTMNVRPAMVNGRPVNTRPIDPPSTAFVQTVKDSNYSGNEEE